MIPLHVRTVSANTDDDGSENGGLTLRVASVVVNAGDAAKRVLVARVTVDGPQTTAQLVASITRNGQNFVKVKASDPVASWKSAEIWVLVNPDEGTYDTLVTLGTADGTRGAGISLYTGVDQVNPTNASGAAQGNGDATISLTPVIPDSLMIDAMSADEGAATPGSGTLRYTESYSFNEHRGSDINAATIQAYTQTYGTANDQWGFVMVALTPYLGIQQEGYRFRADTEAENGTTWLANQDTVITRAKEVATRLRVLLNTTGDQPSLPFQLEYKKSTESIYKKILASGEKQITPLDSVIEHDTTQGNFNFSLRYDDTHVINVWQGSGGDGFIQMFEVSAAGVITELGTPLEFDTTDNLGVSGCVFDTNKIILFWAGSASDGYTRTFQINTSTWAITTWGSAALEYDTTNGTFPSCAQIDSNHFINAWRGPGDDGFIRAFEVNLSTGAVTAVGSAALEFDTLDGMYMKIVAIDGTHFLLTWSGSGADGYARIFTVNTGTWAVTGEGTALEYDTTNGTHLALCLLDSNHVLVVNNGTAGDGYVRVLEINLSTWAVTQPGSALEFDTADYTFGSIALIDTTRFILFWTSTGGTGLYQMFSVNLSTWAITALGSPATFDNSGSNNYNSVVKVTSTIFAAFWSGADNDGYARAYQIDGTAIILTPSSNITTSGENTTALLAAPSGKTTSDFVAGRIQDDENPADAVNVTSDDYTELEWCLMAIASVATDDVYTFRVTANGSLIDPYTVTPQWTIGLPSTDTESERSAKIHGTGTTNSERAAKVTGKSTSNSERAGKLTGKTTANSERAGHLIGTTTANSERSAKITGKTTANSDRAGKITGKQSANSERSATLLGTATTSSERAAKLEGIAETGVNSQRSAKITGQAVTNSERLGKITGKQATNSERAGKITGQATTNSERAGKITGQATTNSERSGKVTGTATANNERNSKVTGKQTSSSERSAKTTGQALTNSERSARIIGGVVSERSAKITGKLTSNSERGGHLLGQALTNSDRAGKVTGTATSNSERSARIIGGVVSEKAVKIYAGYQFSVNDTFDTTDNKDAVNTTAKWEGDGEITLE